MNMPGNEQKDEWENQKRNGKKKFPDEVSVLTRFRSSKIIGELSQQRFSRAGNLLRVSDKK